VLLNKEADRALSISTLDM